MENLTAITNTSVRKKRSGKKNVGHQLARVLVMFMLVFTAAVTTVQIESYAMFDFFSDEDTTASTFGTLNDTVEKVFRDSFSVAMLAVAGVAALVLLGILLGLLVTGNAMKRSELINRILIVFFVIFFVSNFFFWFGLANIDTLESGETGMYMIQQVT